ncbi:MAG: glycosyltransferase family 4 protein [Bacteroidaceae bacterium]|nr:glycosyltransferase family 4 protein [Bacteroidaceae bacterium]
MKVLFVLLDLPAESKAGDMYTSLSEQFHHNGHEVTIIAPDVAHAKTFMATERDMRIVRVASKETQGVASMFKKGIALATLARYFKQGYNKYLAGEKFDWIVMPTPPITLSGFVKYVKRRTGAKFYLILRDIHPQSVWSIGLLHNRLEYKFLDKKARTGYQTADLIGCMSQGNIDFIRGQYPGMKMGEGVLLYNWVTEPPKAEPDATLRSRLDLEGKFVALFGGNMGKGQRIENIVYLAEHYIEQKDIVFLIIAKGVEKDRLQRIAEEKHLINIRFMDFMPQKDYLNLTKSVDLGMVSINENYRVPTCPSKAISYMAAGVPVLAMINPGSDYGQWIEDAGAGYWTVGSDKERTFELFDKLKDDPHLRKQMSESGKAFYQKNCTPEEAYRIMINQMNTYK